MLNVLIGFFAFNTGFWPPLSIAAAGACWTALTALCVAGVLARQRKASFGKTPLDAAAISFLAIWLIASLAGRDPADSFQRFGSQIRFALFYLIVWFLTDGERAKMLKGYLWGAGAACLYGLGQFILWRVVYDGPPHWFVQLPPKLMRYLTLVEGRVHGAVHPLTFAEVLLPAFFIYVVYYLQAHNWGRRFFWLAWALLAESVLLLTQSRGPWIGVAAGLAVIFALSPRRLWLAAPAVLAAGVILWAPNLQDRLSTLAVDQADPSTSIRFTLWKGGAYIIQKEPLLGVGPGQLRGAVLHYEKNADYPPNPYGFKNDLHNQYLQMWAERGVLGLAAFMWILAIAGFLSWRAWRSERAGTPGTFPSGTFLAVGAAVAAFPFLNLTERAFDDAEVALVFWILLGLVHVRHSRENGNPAASVRSPASTNTAGFPLSRE
jgi:O-antigen ligase